MTRLGLICQPNAFGISRPLKERRHAPARTHNYTNSHCPSLSFTHTHRALAEVIALLTLTSISLTPSLCFTWFWHKQAKSQIHQCRYTHLDKCLFVDAFGVKTQIRFGCSTILRLLLCPSFLSKQHLWWFKRLRPSGALTDQILLVSCLSENLPQIEINGSLQTHSREFSWSLTKATAIESRHNALKFLSLIFKDVMECLCTKNQWEANKSTQAVLFDAGQSLSKTHTGWHTHTHSSQ